MTLDLVQSTTGPWLAPGPVVGVELGLGRELEAEHDVAMAYAALRAAGLAGVAAGEWVCTAPVGRATGSEHVGLALVLPGLTGLGLTEATRVAEATGVAEGGLAGVLATIRDALAAAMPPGRDLALTVGDDCLGAPTACALAAEAQASLEFGFGARAVVFPGRDALTGDVPLGAVRALGFDVRSMDGRDHDDATVVTTRGHVRPRLEAGRWVLHVQPAIGGTLVPFETPTPTPCCKDH